ncbi:MAG: hypothetical protein J0M34_08880 [Alphaproteobacteria bacterium]|nr:hypothetical protein [Alphaproteobacteria bacterium]
MSDPIADAGQGADQAAKRAVGRFTSNFQRLADQLREAKIKRLDVEHTLKALGYDITSQDYLDILEASKTHAFVKTTDAHAAAFLSYDAKVPGLIQDVHNAQRRIFELGESMRLQRGNRNISSRAQIDEVANRIIGEVDAAVEAHRQSLNPSSKALVVTKTVSNSADDGVKPITQAGEQLAEEGKGIAKWVSKHKLPLAAGAVALAAGGWALSEMGKKAEAESKPKQL